MQYNHAHFPISHYIMYYCRQFRHPVWCSSAKVPILLLWAVMPEWCMGKRERSRVPVTWTSFTLGHSLGLGQSVRSQPCMQLEDGWDHSRMLTHSINTLTVKVKSTSSKWHDPTIDYRNHENITDCHYSDLLHSCNIGIWTGMSREERKLLWLIPIFYRYWKAVLQRGKQRSLKSPS